MSLYDKDHRYTSQATALQEATDSAIKNIFREYVEAGHSPREIAHVMNAAVSDLELGAILDGKG